MYYMCHATKRERDNNLYAFRTIDIHHVHVSKIRLSKYSNENSIESCIKCVHDILSISNSTHLKQPKNIKMRKLKCAANKKFE